VSAFPFNDRLLVGLGSGDVMGEDRIGEMLVGPGGPLTAGCNCPASPAVVIVVGGEIDLATLQRFEQRLSIHLRPGAETVEITVDLSTVTFISARGISVLAEAADRAARLEIAFNLVGCTPWTARIIAMWQTLTPLATWLV